jgi:pilus assembly protein CpaF
MRNLRSLIESEEKKVQEQKNSFVQDETVEEAPKPSFKEHIMSVKSNNRKTELNFPHIYENSDLLDIAYLIYDDFLRKLKSDKKITKNVLEEVLPEFISHFEETRTLSKDVTDEIQLFIINQLIGYGPLSFIFQITGDGLNDIIVNTKNYVDIIYKGKTVQTPFIFRSEAELRKVIDKMLAENNRKIDEAHPIISSKLKDGSRVEVQIPPIAANDGSCITIRKFQEVPLLFEHLIASAQMDYKMAYFLLKAAKGKCNIIVSGGTSSGKTTFLNTVTRFVDEGEQVMTIEDTKEMQPQMPCHSVRAYEGRMANEEGKGEITLDFLLRSALRSAPRRIVVGECRGPEIVVMLNAMNTGHPGSMTTVHADNTKEAIVRIENMYLEARPTADIGFIRAQIVSAVDIILQLVRFPDGSRKVVAISELEKRVEDNGVVSLNNIFEFKRDNSDTNKTVGKFSSLSAASRSLEKMHMYGIDFDKRVFNDDFEVTKEMLMDELAKDLPDKMCGWKEYFMDVYYQNDQEIFFKWPHLQQLVKRGRHE